MRIHRPNRRQRQRPLFIESLESRRLLATFEVTNADDVGAGSLREALLAANAQLNVQGPDIITFNIPGVGPHKIQPATPLPLVDEAVHIDGYTQPGASRNTNPLADGTDAVLQIEIDGGLLLDGDGLVLTARGQQSTVEGLVINRFPNAAIRVDLSNGNTIRGNFLGTNVAGTAAAGPSFLGILITDGGQNIIGGQTPADRNLISGNDTSGIAIQALSDASQNVIQGNLIGVARDGINPLGNGADGITLGNADATQIGGTSSPEVGNIIAHNNGNGVSVVGSAAISNSILGNSIFANQQLPIDLGRDGPTPNDAGDFDQGPNTLQNFPVLVSATSDATTTTLSGSLSSLPDTNYRLEFFVSTVATTTGQSAPLRFLGALPVTIPNGQTSTTFTNVVFPFPVPRGQQITATATNDNGDTSEFSAPIAQQDNHDPVAGDDMFAVDEDSILSTGVSGSLLDNDTDLDGDMLTVANADSTSMLGATVNVLADGSFTYDPSTTASLQALSVGTNAADSFVYQVDDANGGTATATVDITVTGVNDAPTANNVLGLAFEDGSTVTIAFAADDIDTDDDAASLNYSIDTLPGEGSVTNNNDGTFTFDPGNDFQDLTVGQMRSVTFTYSAIDQHTSVSDTATATVTVIGVNDAPSFAITGNIAVDEDAGPQTISGFASNISPGNGDVGQSLAFDATVTPTTGSIAFTTAPAVDSATGNLTFETAANTNGSATVVVQLMDNGSVGGPIVLTFPAADTGLLADGDTFSITESTSGTTTTFEFDNDQDVTNGNIAIPFDTDSLADDVATAFVNAATVAGLSFTPGILGNGNVLASGSSDEATVDITSSPSLTLTSGPNGLNTSAAQTFTITVNPLNDAPVAANVGTFAFEDGAPVIAPFDANDVDMGDDPASLTFVLDSLPAEGVVTNNNDGTFTFDPGIDFQDLTVGQTRTVTFTYQATDQGNAVSNTATATVTVIGVNDAPSFAITGDVTVDEDAGPQTISGFASNISPGNGDVGQSLNFDATVTSTTGSVAFTTAPAVDSATGNLTFETSLNANGSATIVAQLTDNGSVGGPVVLTFSAADTGLLADGDTFSITETTSGTTTTFEFDNDQDVTNGNLAIPFDTDSLADDVATVFVAAATVVGLSFTSVNLGNGDVLVSGSSDDATVDISNSPSLTLTSGPNGVSASTAQTFSITVAPVNDAPVLNNEFIPHLKPVRTDEIDNPGTAIASLLSENGDLISDVDQGAVEGIAIIATTGEGQWEFAVDGNSTFMPFGETSNTNALLLTDLNVIRYQPPTVAGMGEPDVPSITFRAWDRTSDGTDTTQNGGTTSFSVETLTVATQVALTLGELRANATDPSKMDLVITDGVFGSKSDHLQLSLDATGTQLVITDNTHVVGDFTDTGNAANSISLPLSRITSGIIEIDLKAGDDSIDIDFNNAPAQGINLSLVINGGQDNDVLTFVNSVALGSGSITMNDQIDDILVLGAITTNDAPITLQAVRSIELNADIMTTGTASNGEVRLTSGHDILGLDCAVIDAGAASVSINGMTGISNVSVRTTGDVSLTSELGGVSGCNGIPSVIADSLTFDVAASVGGALLVNGTLSVIAPLQVDVNEVHGTVGGLGIFLANPRALVVDTVVAVGASPFGQKVISLSAVAANAPQSEGEASPWQNQRNALDVNDDSHVSPLDALATINFLTGATTIGAGEGELLSPVMMYLDVNGDLAVSAVDVLQIINYLNSAKTILGEGESAQLGRIVQRDSINLTSQRREITPVGVVPQDQRPGIADTPAVDARGRDHSRAIAETDHRTAIDRELSRELITACDELSHDVAEQWYAADRLR